ncbi:AbiV family abortive infection protein [candidate division WWE3 bacterium]|uniref:AbiV family abortive infection protein n=1 Tax=candidate division WWE3 bacterium TaxID=2053526 RepID=A0A7X9E6Y9_UNCKA|nr:AbiV family abortive infection protein [candidate division WWE3 bacterium]
MSTKLNYESIANRARNNALDLLLEAKLLAENERFARAFFLACLSLEELGKSQMTLDYAAGLITRDNLEKAFAGGKAHALKLAYQHRWMELKNIGRVTASIKYNLQEGERLQKLKELAVYTAEKKNPEQDWKALAEEEVKFVDDWFYDIMYAEWLNSPKRGSKSLWK